MLLCGAVGAAGAQYVSHIIAPAQSAMPMVVVLFAFALLCLACYLALVRPVDLSREAGQTEQLKVGSIVHRELLIAAAASGVFLGQSLKIGPGPSETGQRPAPAVVREAVRTPSRDSAPTRADRARPAHR